MVTSSVAQIFRGVGMETIWKETYQMVNGCFHRDEEEAETEGDGLW